MPTYVSYAELNEQSEQIAEIFGAAAQRTHGAKDFKKIIKEVGGIEPQSDLRPHGHSFGYHLSDLTPDTPKPAYLVDVDFTDEEKTQLETAGATVTANKPDGYRTYLMLNR